jgi:endonuclease/exonuclease/phosphatase (EEP) superfamily protein YafD
VIRIISRAVRWLTTAGATLYCIAIVVLAAFWSFAPDAHWSIAFSNIFAAGFFLPLLLFGPAALLLRTRWMYLVTALPLVVFLTLFGRRFVPHTGTVVAGATTLRVVTFNQLFLDTNVQSLLAAILAQHADVVALQELAPPVAEAIRRNLQTIYPYQILAPSNSASGTGLLSRYPLEPADRVNDGAQGQWAILHVSGQTIAVVNVHLHFSGISRIRSQRFGSLTYFRIYDTHGRLAQANALREAARTVSGALIMMGDFNTGDREPGHAVLAAELHDAFAETGWGFGFTFPNDKRIGPITIPVPLVRIDCIWTRGPVVPVATHVNCDDGGSDHCMVVADLRIEN